MNVQIAKGDRLFHAISRLYLLLALFVCIYPLYFVIIASFSDYTYIYRGEVWLLPKGFNLEAYKKVLSYERLWRGYYNTIIYTVAGTSLSLIVSLMTGYALSRKDLVGRNIVSYLLVFTMIFNGGLIPTYLAVKNLGLLNSMWALILPQLLAVYNVIVCRTFFRSSIPDSLLDSARIDGCSNSRFFFGIVLPLSKAIIAVMAIFYAVSYWNMFFPALIYLQDDKKFPLQLILREILLLSQSEDAIGGDAVSGMDQTSLLRLTEQIKYGSIVIATLPLLILYPLAQKYFVGGVMIGAIKG